MDFVEICNVCTRKVIIKAAKKIFNSDKIWCSYCDFYFGVTFFGTHCILINKNSNGVQCVMANMLHTSNIVIIIIIINFVL